MTTTSTRQTDVVDLLIEQHQQIKRMFTEFQAAPAAKRKELFHDIVRFLAVHEAAEELVVHPAVRHAADDAEAVVKHRLDEESKAKQSLNDLYDLGTEHPDFDTKFSVFAADVVRHAEQEQDEEFPILLREIPEDRRRQMARAVQAAEAIAPTRPHPRAGESVAANLVGGPPLAIFDRVRDALRDWQDR